MQVAEPYCKIDNLGRVLIPSPFPLVALYLLSFSYAIHNTQFHAKAVDTKINYSHSKVNSEQSLVFLIIKTLRDRRFSQSGWRPCGSSRLMDRAHALSTDHDSEIRRHDLQSNSKEVIHRVFLFMLLLTTTAIHAYQPVINGYATVQE